MAEMKTKKRERSPNHSIAPAGTTQYGNDVREISGPESPTSTQLGSASTKPLSISNATKRKPRRTNAISSNDGDKPSSSKLVMKNTQGRSTTTELGTGEENSTGQRMLNDCGRSNTSFSESIKSLSSFETSNAAPSKQMLEEVFHSLDDFMDILAFIEDTFKKQLDKTRANIPSMLKLLKATHEEANIGESVQPKDK